ncbi:MAG: adenylyl-sulfate kinase [Methanophagales archaeon]|nr:adenylyl-sulfate kinase [Methanophagales archaeon]MCW3141974.1 adenylyl-sulfate kinase [Methanophagales archaeon]
MTWAIWVTGLPGSGKTAIAQKVRNILIARGVNVTVLELDKIRKFITPKPSYSEEERDIVYSSLVYMAKLLVESGKPVIIDATANRRKYRERARKSIENFAEVFIKCSLDTCMERERRRKAEYAPSGIYKGAKKEGATVPGVNVPYEKPENPEVVVDSEKMSVEECADEVVEFIKRHLKKEL